MNLHALLNLFIEFSVRSKKQHDANRVQRGFPHEVGKLPLRVGLFQGKRPYLLSMLLTPTYPLILTNQIYNPRTTPNLMENKITFLGTAGDSFVLNKQRSAAGIIIQSNNTQIHINPGPGALYRAKASGFNPRETTAVIVTDNTLLHAHDTNAIIDQMTLGGFDTTGLLLAAKSAITNESTPASIFSFYQNAVERTIAMEPGNKVEYNHIQINAIPIKNSDKAAVGLKLITKDFSLAYTNKTKYTAKLKEQLKGVEILILELPLFALKKNEDGLSLAEAERLITEIRPQLAVLTGFGVDLLKQDILELTRNINRTTKVQTIAANDGFSFDPTSYAVKLRQKRLPF
jgi:hypothetical protein